MTFLPLRRDKLDNAVFGFFQPGTTLADNGIAGALDMIRHRRQRTLTLTGTAITGHALQRGFDVQQRACHIHQQGAIRRALAGGDGINHFKLVFNQFARLTQTKHGNRIGNLLERLALRLELAAVSFFVVDERFESILDLVDFLGQRRHHGGHSRLIRATHLGAFRADQLVRRQCITEAITLSNLTQVRAVRITLGDVIQQVLHQLRRGSLGQY